MPTEESERGGGKHGSLPIDSCSCINGMSMVTTRAPYIMIPPLKCPTENPTVVLLGDLEGRLKGAVALYIDGK